VGIGKRREELQRKARRATCPRLFPRCNYSFSGKFGANLGTPSDVLLLFFILLVRTQNAHPKFLSFSKGKFELY